MFAGGVVDLFSAVDVIVDGCRTVESTTETDDIWLISKSDDEGLLEGEMKCALVVGVGVRGSSKTLGSWRLDIDRRASYLSGVVGGWSARGVGGSSCSETGGGFTMTGFEVWRPGAGVVEHGAWSVERGAWNVERGVKDTAGGTTELVVGKAVIGTVSKQAEGEAVIGGGVKLEGLKGEWKFESSSDSEESSGLEA